MATTQLAVKRENYRMALERLRTVERELERLTIDHFDAAIAYDDAKESLNAFEREYGCT